MPTPKPPPERKKNSWSTAGLGDIAYYILVALLVAALLFILYTLAQQKIAPMRRGKVRKAVREAAEESPRAPSAEELADAEAAALAAAAEGRFDEAIHLLLLGAIGRLREKNARTAARSLTSREILARVMLGPEDGAAKSALQALVATVEISRFGGRPVDAQAFERCLEAYRALRRAIAVGSSSRIPKGGGELSGAGA